MRRRRIVGRPLLVATATLAAVAYACGSETSGNLGVPFYDAGVDMGVSETSGNLAPVDSGTDRSVTDAGVDAPSEAAADASRDAADGG